jgi:hypothetical protein
VTGRRDLLARPRMDREDDGAGLREGDEPVDRLSEPSRVVD